ncbi:MAG: response regulator [Albidovulum sp.]
MSSSTRRPHRIGIKRQMLLIASVPAFVATSLMVLMSYHNNVRHNREQLERQGQLLAAQLAGALEYALVAGDRAQVPTTVSATIKPVAAILGTPVREVIVTDDEGLDLYRMPDADPRSSRSETAGHTPDASEETARFSAPVVLRPVALDDGDAPIPRPLGQVAVALSLSAAQARWRYRLGWDLIWIVATFAVIAGSTYGFGRQLSNAIGRIARAVQAIKNGDLATRLPQIDRNELGTLEEGVNLLADTIERGKARLDAELAKVRGEYRDALQALERANRDLEQANQAKSLFLAKISHEMRTPLQTILSLIESLLKAKRPPAETQNLHHIEEATHRLKSHIEDILGVTKLVQWVKEGQALACDETVNAWAELEAVSALQEPRMSERALYLDLVVAADVPAAIKSNIKAIREIFSNLLGNAVKYTQSGGIAIWLEVVPWPSAPGSRPRRALRLRVIDSGCGIPEDKLGTIFREFEQVDEAYNRRHGGTGLGLSFVKKNCHLLDGKVDVFSVVDKGSTFTVELPCHPADETPGGRPLGGPALPTGWRALVADERSSFRASVIARLTALDIAVVEQDRSPFALAASRPAGLRYDLLIVQGLADFPESVVPALIAGLRRWAITLVALEADYGVPARQRLEQNGLDAVLWTGATRAQLREALALHGQIREAPVEEPDKAVSPASLPLAGRTVLLVEDIDLNRSILMDQLTGNGARVLEAPDGETAVRLAAEPGLDIILMDIQMPGMDGFEAIEAIRRMSCGARLPILGFTASADRPTHERILRVGADGVVHKPITESQLIDAIQHALRQNRARSLS